MRIIRTTTLLALLAAIAAAASSIPASNRAMAEMMKMCPQFEAEYCVVDHGFKHTAWTNPCFAKQSGMRIVHKGACKGMPGQGMH